MTDKISPTAKAVIEKCGGVRAVSAITGLSESSIYKWTYSAQKGGTGGLVPSRAQVALIEAAKRGEVDLKPEDFFEQESS